MLTVGTPPAARLAVPRGVLLASASTTARPVMMRILTTWAAVADPSGPGPPASAASPATVLGNAVVRHLTVGAVLTVGPTPVGLVLAAGTMATPGPSSTRIATTVAVVAVAVNWSRRVVRWRWFNRWFFFNSV